jgi:hypothetical protein
MAALISGAERRVRAQCAKSFAQIRKKIQQSRIGPLPKNDFKLGMVVHTCNPSTQEAKAGRF